MDWNIAWLVTGSAAFLLAIINLIRSLSSKQKGSQALLFASLSCGVLTLLEEYQMVNTWLMYGDLAALEDVVPTMTHTLAIASYTGIALNLAVLIINVRKQMKTE